MTSSGWLLIGIVLVLFLGRRALVTDQDAGAILVPSACSSSSADRPDSRFEFEIVHRRFVSLEREFDSTEAKCGVIALAAITLLAVHFPSTVSVFERALETMLGVSTAIAVGGFLLFRGYEPFDPLEFQRAYRGDRSAALEIYAAKMAEEYHHNRSAIRAKSVSA